MDSIFGKMDDVVENLPHTGPAENLSRNLRLASDFYSRAFASRIRVKEDA